MANQGRTCTDWETMNTSKMEASGADKGHGFDRLQLRHMIGFNGRISSGLIVHSSGRYLIYCVGSCIVVEEIVGKGAGTQELLLGHTDTITAFGHVKTMDGSWHLGSRQNKSARPGSSCGSFVPRRNCSTTPYTRQRVESIIFSFFTKHFVTLGGQDDGTLTVWSSKERKPLISQPSQLRRVGVMYCMTASKIDDKIFAVAGDGYGRIWTFDPVEVTLDFVEIRFSPWTRVVTCMEMADLDNSQVPILFCGTSSGDVMVFHGRTGVLQCVVPGKPFPGGVTCLTYVRMLESRKFAVLVGTGAGKVGYYSITTEIDAHHKAVGAMKAIDGLKAWTEERETSPITSISKLGVGQQFYVGTRDCKLYLFNLSKMTAQLVRTCSCSPINAIAFPRATDELMVTGEPEKVRVMNLRLLLEVRRYNRAGRTCSAVVLNHDGTQIFTGWDDGDTIVLGFEPKGLSLKELYRIQNTQKQAITSLDLTSKSDVLISGGLDGQCRVWRLVDDTDPTGRRIRQGLLEHQVAEHAGPVTMIKVANNDELCASCSADGSVAIWDIENGVKKFVVKLEMGLTGVDFCNNGLHLITCGADGKILYWESATGECIRSVQGVSFGGINSLNVDNTGQLFASCADDNLVKLWSANKGEVTHVGQAHSERITKVKFSPCGSVLVSCGTDGAICIWLNPAVTCG